LVGDKKNCALAHAAIPSDADLRQHASVPRREIVDNKPTTPTWTSW
jgi:hypothetical protein